MAQNINFDTQVIDFSQIPLLLRTLSLENGSNYDFTSLDPRNNTLVPLTIEVTGENKILNISCYEVELNDFEGKAVYWVEKEGEHRILRIYQPESQRTIEVLSK